MISTPAAKQGLFFNFFEEGFKVPGRFTAQAPTVYMNPLVDQKFLEKEKARDIDNYLREFEAKFAEKMESFFSYDLLNECFTLSGDQKYLSNFTYNLGIDASGLAGRDLFGLAVSHRQGLKIIVDYAKSFNTQNLDVIMKEIKNIKKNFNIKISVIDKYAKGFVRAFLQKLGLVVIVRPSLADIYINFKSIAIAGNLLLPINKELKTGLINTQAYYSKSNSLTIGHSRGANGHSDLGDAVVTTVYQSSRIIKDNELEQIIHNEGPFGIWVEEPPGKEKPFNFLHLVTPEEQKKKEENEGFDW
jgi:phage terminase large subunit-like protein